MSSGYTIIPSNAQWLALRQEDTMEPNLSIGDANDHLREEPGNRMCFPT
jgi:hypothetical protein